MGVIRWLDSIDPQVWRDATMRIENEGAALLTSMASAAFLQSFGRAPADDAFEVLEDPEDDALVGERLNNLLETAVTDVVWSLDKALDGFGPLASKLPGGRALRKIIDFQGIDVDVPEPCRMIEGGLYGCCSPASLADLYELASKYRDPVAVNEILPQQILGDSYHAMYWDALCAAVVTTTEKGHYLGLGMSP